MKLPLFWCCRASGRVRPLVCRHIHQPQLHALFTLPSVDRDLAGGMQGTAAILHERYAKRLAGSTESNCIHEFTIARSQARADMAFTNGLGIDERMRRQREDRLRITRSIGSCA